MGNGLIVFMVMAWQGIEETAKANNLKFYDYFEYLLTGISKHTEDQNTDFLAEFLP